MNFLAHIYLSGTEDDLIVGNYLGDMLKKKEVDTMPADILRGIYLHRAIDSYTDGHEEVKKCIRRIYPHQGKYAPVVLDVYFDYVLSQNWTRYSELDLRAFCSKSQETLMSYMELMPERVQKRTSSMVGADFLYMYGKEEGMRETFRRIGMRASFQNNLESAFGDVSQYYADIEKSFFLFFEDLESYVAKWLEENPKSKKN